MLLAEPEWPVTTFLLPLNNNPKLVSAHYQRLYHAAVILGVWCPWSHQQQFDTFIRGLQQQLSLEQIERAKQGNLVCRLQLGPNGVAVEYREMPVKRQVALWVVDHALRAYPNLKTNNYTLEQQLLTQAEVYGCNELLRITPEGFVSETAYSNIFVKTRSGQWLTPCPSQSHCLWGTEAQGFTEQLQKQGKTVQQVLLPLSQLLSTSTWAKCVITNAIRGVEPVKTIVYLDSQWHF